MNKSLHFRGEIDLGGPADCAVGGPNLVQQRSESGGPVGGPNLVDHLAGQNKLR